ncbi:hypothetical protein [Vibrio harveyi]|uniref:hypothetical protein n=2 Tax=Vibrio harveyi TaxID=669 RepID=UPI000C7D7445|nr:hypothetical protein [Vibrio harveyi]MBY6235450.1 hypothetical protein [Vibrio harveyi]
MRNRLKKKDIIMMLTAILIFMFIFISFHLTLVGVNPSEVTDFEIFEVYCEPTLRLANGTESNSVCKFKGSTNGEKISGYALSYCDLNKDKMFLNESRSIFGHKVIYTLNCK